MTRSDPTGLAETLGALLSAQDRQRAQRIASALIDDVVPGGAVVAPEASLLLDLIELQISRVVASEYRADVMGVLTVVATWSRTWHRLNEERPGGVAEERLAEEDVVKSSLVHLSDSLETLRGDVDPEVRAMLLLFLGAGANEAKALAYIEESSRLETDSRVRACAAQALIKLLARSDGNTQAASSGLLDRLLSTGSDEQRSRVALEVDSVAHLPAAKQRLRELVGARLAENSDAVKLWPAETL